MGPTSEPIIDPISLINLKQSALSPTQRIQLVQLLRKYQDVFSSGPLDKGRTTLSEHKVDTGDHPPIKPRFYNVPHAQLPGLKKQVKEMLDAGIVTPSHSPWSSPVVVVKKKDGSDRVCIDYRRLNRITKRDVYPLPLIHTIFDKLGKAKFLTTLDMDVGFHQIPIAEADREKSAFITPFGLFQYETMPFGMCNAPASFQSTMDLIFREFLNEFCAVYIDDLIIYSETFEQHLLHLEKVFQRFREANLKLKPK